MASPRTHYWDSCVALVYVNADDPVRLKNVEEMLDDAARGEILLITSVISVAEVAFGALERTARALDPSIEERIDTLWAPIGPIRLVECHLLITEDARDIQRSGVGDGWTGLKGADAIHLATAQRQGVDEINTYDPGWPKWSPKVGIPIREPLSAKPTLGLGLGPS
jgi:predicted nucleic acid-binding protein